MTPTTAAGPAEPPDGGLSGLRVLVPRVTTPADPLVIALTAAGAEPVAVQLIATVPPEDTTELDDLLLALGEGWYGWLAVTSAAAVPVLVSRVGDAGTTLPALLERGGARVAAVGPGTARALRAADVEPDLVPPATSSARALLDAWPDEPPSRVLLPHADLAAPTLEDGLTARGWPVEAVVAYRTVRGPEPEPSVVASWRTGALGAALLTSASAARHLVELLGPPPAATLVCCIGERTAEAATDLGLTVAAVATEQTPAGLVTALARAAGRSGTMSPSGPSPGAPSTTPR